MNKTRRYPMYLEMAMDLASRLEKRGGLDCLAMALTMRAYEETFFAWERSKPEHSGKVIAEFISDARRAQELLTPSLSPTSSGRE